MYVPAPFCWVTACGRLPPSAEGHGPVPWPPPCRGPLEGPLLLSLGATMAPRCPSFADNNLILVGFLTYWPHTCK